MSVFRLVGARSKPGQRSAITAWYASEQGRNIVRRMQAETHVRYVCTYLTVGERSSPPADDEPDVYDLWEAPDLASFDRLPDSPAYAEFEERFHPLLVDQSWKVVHLELANG